MNQNEPIDLQRHVQKRNSPFLTVALMMALLQFAVARASAGTVALWLFDDPVASKSGIDSSGNGRDLSIGAGAAIVSGGRFGNALDADAGPVGAIGAYRDRVDEPLNPGNQSWTLECWVKAKSGINSDNRIWGLSGVNYIDYGRKTVLQGLNVANQFLPAGGKWDCPTGKLEGDNHWHHIAVVNDAKAGQIRHFFDGKRTYEAAARWEAIEFNPKFEAVFPPQYPQLQVGWRDSIQQWGPSELHGELGPRKRFGGLIDEMRFSDEALYLGDFTPPTSLAQPFLRVAPRALSISGTEGTLSISSGTTPIGWSLETSESWLKTTASQGEASDAASPIAITVNVSALKAGQHSGTIRITPKGIKQQPIDVKVMVTVTPAGSVIDVGDRRQLMLDHRFIEREENVALHVNQPEHVNIDFPIQEDRPIHPSNIIYLKDQKRWRMYYNALNKGHSLRFIESEDGLHWSVPSNNVAVHGAEKTALRMGGIMLDEHDSPERRFKAFQEERGKEPPDVRGIYAFYSADGVNFTDAGRVLPMPAEIFVTAYWDARINKYVAYLRVENSTDGLKNMEGNQFFIRPDGKSQQINHETLNKPGYENARAIGRIETDDLLKPWPFNKNAPPTVYTTASSLPMVLNTDPEDGFVDFYTSAAWIYPYAQEVYLAFPAAFRHFHSSRQPTFHQFADANGPLEAQLCTSRDGIHWDRQNRAAYVSMGTTTQQDRWLNMMGVGAVRSGDWLYQYYWSTGRLHDSVLLRPELEDPVKRAGKLFAARQRLDGFVSADTDYKGGWLSTPPIRFSGRRLLLNHNCNATGTIFVEMRDLNDMPIEGYTLAECEEITCNDTGWEVRWRDKGSDVSSLSGRPLKIYFRMRNAKLYAFEFAPAPKTLSTAPIEAAVKQ